MAEDWSKDVGWKASGPSLLWGALGGLAASILVGIPMQASMDAIRNTAAALVGSDSLAVGWAVHLAAGVVFGALYGLFVATRNLGHGAAWGLLYGLLVGLVPVWIGVNLLLGRGLPVDVTGAMQVMVHVAWGLVVGLVAAWGLKRMGETPRRARLGRTA